MSSNEPFNFDSEDLQRFVRGAEEQLRSALGQVGRFVEGPAAEWSGRFGTRKAAERPETTGDSGDGVWVIYVVDDDGSARIEQLHLTELDALRANQHNTASIRRVRFLPFGMPVSVLDGPDEQSNG